MIIAKNDREGWMHHEPDPAWTPEGLPVYGEPAPCLGPPRICFRFECRTPDEEALCEQLIAAMDTYRRKNADYGDAWKRLGLRGVFVRLYHRNQRLLNLLWSGQAAQIVSESTADTLADTLLYNAMALVLLHEENIDGTQPGRIGESE